MKTLKSIVILFLLTLIGCATYKQSNNPFDEYEVEYIDKDISDNFFVYILNNHSETRIVLFSDKSDRYNNIIPFTKYKQLSVGSKCNIDVHLDTTKYIFHPSGVNSRIQVPYKIFLTDIPFLQDDTVICKIYRSKNVYDCFCGE